MRAYFAMVYRADGDIRRRASGALPSGAGDAGENPARLPGRGIGTPDQSALALRQRDQIKVEVSPSSSSKRLA